MYLQKEKLTLYHYEPFIYYDHFINIIMLKIILNWKIRKYYQMMSLFNNIIIF